MLIRKLLTISANCVCFCFKNKKYFRGRVHAFLQKVSEENLCYILEYHNTEWTIQLVPIGKVIASFFLYPIKSKKMPNALLLKISKFRKQIFLFSFEPKIERNYFSIGTNCMVHSVLWYSRM